MKFSYLLFFCLLPGTLFAGIDTTEKTREAKAKEWIKNQPKAFIENNGQFTDTDGNIADNVLFKTSFQNCDIYITTKGLSYVFIKSVTEESDTIIKSSFHGQEHVSRKLSYYRLDMNLEGAKIDKQNVIKEHPIEQGYINYFYAHCANGIFNTQEYGKITITNIYKGIDWIIYTNTGTEGKHLKYDFVVHPQADYKDIKINFLNAKSTNLLENDTRLIIETIAGQIEEGNLYTYISDETEDQCLSSKYVINKDNSIEFEIESFDKTKTLVIDPLVWATYYGGSTDFDYLESICVDSQDNVYISGSSNSTDFPIQQQAGAFWQGNKAGAYDIIILKFNSKGVRQWTTFYGGGSEDLGSSVCIDNKDNLYITGFTRSSNFPLKKLAGAYWQNTFTNYFLIKFNSQGVLNWATFYGDMSEHKPNICSDNENNIYVSGNTYSQNCPLQQLTGAYFQPVNAGELDVFIIKFDNQGQRRWTTYYGGESIDHSSSLCTDNQCNLYVSGITTSKDFPIQELNGAYFQENNNAVAFTTFILKFDKNGVRQWATYYGGSGGEQSHSICSDSEDNIYITGNSSSFDFPAQQVPGAYFQTYSFGFNGIFIIKFNNQNKLVWGTLYGGGNWDEGLSIMSDQENNVYLTGFTRSGNFPVQQLHEEYWQANNAGTDDIFILKFNDQGVRLWSTYYGGTGWDIGNALAVDNKNNMYLTGNLGVTSNAYTIDYGNGAYFDNNLNNGNQGCILKIENCFVQKPTSIKTDRNNICINDMGNIVLSAIGGVGDSLKWYSDNSCTTYIGSNTPFIIPSPIQTKTLYARWESLCDTSACDSIVITIFSEITSMISRQICHGETFSIGYHTYTTSGIYNDTLKTVSGCDSIVVTNLTVNPKVEHFINPQICQGETFSVGIHKYETSGLYSDTLTSLLACDSIIITNLTVNPNPAVSLGNDTILCPNEKITLSPGSGFSQYVWSDGSTENYLVINIPGIYTILVNDGLCSNIDSINIVDCASNLWLPNAFSPNGDALNDYFNPIISGMINSYRLLIYNRWGQQIFETNNLNVGWDGTYNGTPCPGELYTYYITYSIKTEPNDLIRKEKRGSVTLVR